MHTKKALPLLFLVMFMVMAGFGIIIPVMPFLVEDMGATPTELGLLMSVYSLMQFIFAPFWGRISDRFGRKPVMLLGIAGLSISFFMTAAADALWVLFAARIIGGILSSANMPTAMAYVADITTEENRSKGMGIIGAATGLGFVFGPAIGGIFSGISLTTPFYIAGSISIITMFLVAFLLKESLPEEQRGKHSPAGRSFRAALGGPHMIIYVLQTIMTLSMAGLEATFAYFASVKAGLDAVQLGYIFMIMGLAGAIVQGGLIGPMTKRFCEAAVIRTGMSISAIGFLLVLFADNFWKAALFLTIFGIGNGVIRPSLSSLLTKGSAGGHGRTTGMLSSFDSLGRILGPTAGGWLFSVSIGFPYIAGACLSLLSLVLFHFFGKQYQMKKSSSV